MYTLGIPKRDYRRATQVLSYETQPPISYHENLQDDGFYMFTFPEAGSEDDFRYIVEKLKGEGIRVIGADSQLTEKQIMKLANLIKINEEVEITSDQEEELMDIMLKYIKDPDDAQDMIDDFFGRTDRGFGKALDISLLGGISGDFEDEINAWKKKHNLREGTCGYSIDGKPADKPAGPHLIRKAIREHIKKLMNNG